MRRTRPLDTLLASYFVLRWGSGFVATKAGLQYAAPFTFLTLRFAFGILCMLPLLLLVKPRWPGSARAWGHVIVAGILMHAVHLSGSHYGQYLGMSAGMVALMLALQPIITAVIAARWLGEPLAQQQWAGVALGLAGVTLVVWHKIDVRAMNLGSLGAVTAALAAITIATLYQRRYCAAIDLNTGAFIQFIAAAGVLAPLAVAFEGLKVTWHPTLLIAIAILVIGASILAVNALHTLMRHGEAARVTSLIYLTPAIAVLAELTFFDVRPTGLAILGGAVTCLGVALVSFRAAHSPA